LVLASFIFYGWWNPVYLGLILSSIIFNYYIGISLNNKSVLANRLLLTIGIVGNLGLLIYFKYANFFISEINNSLGMDFHFQSIILPLAISFFTFQQIAYLVDVYEGETSESNFLHYCIFVSFFPQLIAGPIVHHKEMLPQFAKDNVYRFNHNNLAIGITIFTIGLFKKVVLADGVAIYATPVFIAAEQGIELTFFEAWGGSLAYTLQLYFDFSGYSDMAIGLARMFSIRLPLNFYSPYKSKNIIEFWHRWHMTLSRFLRDYLYIPLGGNQKGKIRRYINLIITMLLGGLWHGAGWTFIAWGFLHSLYLVINHGWRHICRVIGLDLSKPSCFYSLFSWGVTFVAILVGWVFFRAESIDGALNILSAMSGGNGISLLVNLKGSFGEFEPWLLSNGIQFNGLFTNELVEWKWSGIQMLSLLFCIALFGPSTQQIMIRHRPAFEIYRGEIKEYKFKWLQWEPNRLTGILIGIMAIMAIMHITRTSEFLYFQF